MLCGSYEEVDGSEVRGRGSAIQHGWRGGTVGVNNIYLS